MSDFLILMKQELMITFIIFLLLFIKIGRGMRNEPLLSFIQVLLLLNFIAGFLFNQSGSLFGNMYYTTPLIAFQKSILSLGVYLISLLCADWLKKTPHLPEFFMLMLSALLGMYLMISSGNLLIFYLSLELASIPVAAMANFDLDKKRSSEGAMKMILSSAFSSGILLFGISLIYGATGTIIFGELSQQLNGKPLQIVAFVFLFAAFAFKLSIVPFHLWTADVYEGSPVATTSFLSVISEGAMKMILSSAFSSGILLFGISLIYGATGTISFGELSQQLNGKPLQIVAFVFLFAAFAFKLSIVPFHLWTADVYEGSPVATTSFLSVISKGAMSFIFITALYKVFAPLQDIWYWMIVALAVITMLVGNLFALRQQNIKRFLAFSSIAQVGFILVGISNGDKAGISSVVYFILIYIFSNLAAFGVAAVITGHSGKENIDDYKGLYKTNPFLSWMMALAMFSLAGIPPTAGFFGKLFLLTSGSGRGNFWLILIAGLNMVISLYYYLKVVRALFMDKNEQPVEKIILSPTVKLGMIICAAGIVLIGLIGPVYDYIQSLI